MCWGDEEIKDALAIKKGRGVAKDIGGSDPERVAAQRGEEYVQVVSRGPRRWR